MKKEREKLWTKNFVFVILINFLVFLNHMMILSTFPFYIISLGGSEAVAGLAATLFSCMAVVSRPVIGWMLDNGKRKAILLFGLCGLALMPIGYIFISFFMLVFVLRMVHGASLALSNTSTSTIATDIIPKHRIGEGMGMFGMATALSTACAPALGLFLMNKMGYTTLFACATGAAVIAIVLFILLKVPKIETVKKPLRLKSLISKEALPASAVVMLFLVTFGALENFLAIYASDKGLPSGGLYFAVMAFMLLLVRVTLGKMADRKGEGIFVYTCNIAMFAAFLLLALVPNTVTFILSAVLAGYAFGGIEPALQSMAVHIAPPDRRGAANSTFLCAYDIGIGIGGGLAGVLITGLGYNQMFIIVSAANILSGILYIAWGRKHPSTLRPSKHGA